MSLSKADLQTIDDTIQVMKLLRDGYVVKAENADGQTFRERYSVWQNLGERAKTVITDQHGNVVGLQG